MLAHLRSRSGFATRQLWNVSPLQRGEAAPSWDMLADIRSSYDEQVPLVLLLLVLLLLALLMLLVLTPRLL